MCFLFTVSCAQKTSTSKEYMNVNKVSKNLYKRDSILLTNVLKSRYDSINNSVSTHILSLKIDTIFYGNDNKIAFLAALSKENKYAEKGVQYAGECYIAQIDKSSIKNISQLTDAATTTSSLTKVSEMIRRIYLREMNYVEGKYNINDNRFWDSYVWQEAEEKRKKREYLEEMKKNHPENVYDPNDKK